MPLFVDVVSKFYVKSLLIEKPSKDVINKYLVSDRKVFLQNYTAITRKPYADIKFDNMYVEQKRKYLWLKYLKKYK